MARWRTVVNFPDVPASALEYSARIHGRGDAGIRTWGKTAREWIAGHPGAGHPYSTPVGVLIEVRRLLNREWFGISG